MGVRVVLWVGVLCALLGCTLPQEEDESGGPSFDCSRTKDSCGEMGMCPFEATDCLCEEFYGGDYCQNNLNETEEVEPKECSPLCENDGICLRTGDDDGATSCQCHQRFYGPTCESKRVMHTCSHNAVDISILPDPGQADFGGIVYVDGHEADDACALKPGDGDEDPLSASIPLDACGGAMLRNEDDGTDYHSFTVVVQYSPTVRRITDERYTFTCQFQPAGSSIESEADLSSPGGAEEDKYNPPEEVLEVLRPFDVSLTDEAGLPLEDTTVKLGQILQLRIQLNGGKVYDSFRVESVMAHNGQDEDKYLDLDLVMDSCPVLVPDGHVIQFYNETIENDDGEAVPVTWLKFRTFRFLHSPKVFFHMFIKVCKEGKNCAPLECDEEPFTGIGRRRKRGIRRAERQQPDVDGAVYREYDTVISVIAEDAGARPYPTMQSEADNKSRDHYCVTRLGLVLTCVLFTLLLVVAAIAVICAWAKPLWTRSRRAEMSPSGGDNQAFSEKL